MLTPCAGSATAELNKVTVYGGNTDRQTALMFPNQGLGSAERTSTSYFAGSERV